MDIRIVKTKRAIRRAFFELRKQQPLEKVKVMDLCRIAEINKATFYKYYQDIYALNNAMEEELFANFVEAFKSAHYLFTDPETFLNDLPRAVDSLDEQMIAIYGGREDAFFNRLENAMSNYYMNNHPENISDAKVNFIICGTVHNFSKMKLMKRAEAAAEAAEIADIIKKLVG